MPLRRTLNTRVGRFTHGPFLLIDLELKGGGVGRVAGFTFVALGQRIVPILLEELAATMKGRKIGVRRCGRGARRLPEALLASGP